MRNLSFYVIISLLVCGFLCTVLPYPFFSNATLLTKLDRQQINEANELEKENIFLSPKPVLSTMSWQDGIDCLLSTDELYSGYDINLNKSFSFRRVGGKNHADIVPDGDAPIFAATPDDQVHAVIVKLSQNLYLPASLSFLCHGYGDDGHYCLYFLGSLTDSTEDESIVHQKNIALARKSFNKIKNSLTF